MRAPLRLLALTAVVASSPAALAQPRSFIDVGVGTNGRGEVVRAAMGVTRGALTPTVRLAVATSSGTTGGRPEEEVGVEVGVGVSRMVALGDRVEVGAGGGLALAFASLDYTDRPPSAFGIARMQAGLLLPLEATALVRVGRDVGLSVTGTRSLSLGTASRDDAPLSEARLPRLDGWGVTAGLRFEM